MRFKSVYVFASTTFIVSVVALFIAVAMLMKTTQVETIDVREGTPFARPVEDRQVTGPSLPEVIIRTGGKIEDTLGPD